MSASKKKKAGVPASVENPLAEAVRLYRHFGLSPEVACAVTGARLPDLRQALDGAVRSAKPSNPYLHT